MRIKIFNFFIICSLLAACLLDVWLSKQVASAQGYPNNYELTCPSGSVPVSGPTGTSFNPSTGKYRANFCIDSFGTMTYQGGGSGTGFAGVNPQAVNYTPVASDCGKLITMNGASLTLTLPNPPLSTSCWFDVMNLNNSILVVSRNSLTINGIASNGSLQATGSGQAFGIARIETDGTNYFMLSTLPIDFSTSNALRFTSNGGLYTLTIGANSPGASFVASSGPLNGATYLTGTNCNSSASPAVCGSAASGSVAIPAGATTLQVNTTAVTANSQIQLTNDDSLGTRLGVTCNTTINQINVSARTGNSNFTITVSAAPITNPECISYTIIN